MNRLCFAILPLALLAAPADAARLTDPLRFWEGRTETVSTIKVVLKKAFRSRSLGRGEIKSDGSLELVQRVEDEGKPPRERRWLIRKAGPNRYVGTMNEAAGPVVIEEVGDRFRFRFKMKGNLSVEQWITPSPGGKTGRNKLTIKKMGMTVAHSEGTIRKLD